jgi:hypothetical protein
MGLLITLIVMLLYLLEWNREHRSLRGCRFLSECECFVKSLYWIKVETALFVNDELTLRFPSQSQ